MSFYNINQKTKFLETAFKVQSSLQASYVFGS